MTTFISTSASINSTYALLPDNGRKQPHFPSFIDIYTFFYIATTCLLTYGEYTSIADAFPREKEGQKGSVAKIVVSVTTLSSHELPRQKWP